MAEKKYVATVNGKTRRFGAKGYSISPGTPKGDNYCARSSGIKKCANPPSKTMLYTLFFFLLYRWELIKAEFKKKVLKRG